MTVNRRIINPWTWQDDLAFVQGVEVDGGRTLYLSGTTAIDDEGNVVHADELGAQVMTALDSIQTILSDAGMDWTNVVRLNWYIKGSHVDDFWSDVFPQFKERLDKAECHAAGTMLGVECLARPELLCEFEATAVA